MKQFKYAIWMARKTVFSDVFVSYTNDWKNYGVEYIFLTSFTDLFLLEKEKEDIRNLGKMGARTFYWLRTEPKAYFSQLGNSH